MKVVLSDKEQIAKFIMCFRGVLGMNDIVSIQCLPDNFYLQAMDKAHSGIVEVKIMNDWFTEYECGDDMCININTLVKVMGCWSPGYKITITDSEERLNVDFTGEKMISKRFEIIKIDIKNDIFNIPEKEYDIDIVLSSDGFKNIIDELQLFNDTLLTTCDADGIYMKTTGDEGSCSIKIKDGDILEYAVALNDGDKFEQNLDITKIADSCNINKLNEEVHVHFSNEDPLKIYYSLDLPNYEGESSYIRFFIAPKML
jgi:proliferating cell nuclear antigen PCNA